MVIVTGCAGFIGSNLVDRLLATGESVIGIDNFSTGQRRFLDGAMLNPKFCLFEIDLLNADALNLAFKGASIVYHLSANADVRFGTEHPRRDFDPAKSSIYSEGLEKGYALKGCFKS